MPNEVDLAVAHLVCRNAVRVLITRYGWTLLTKEELEGLVMESVRTNGWPPQLDELVISIYSAALYQACQQTEDSERRERAYTDLFHALYRVAYKKWPDMSLEVSERALSLVAEQIERCRNPRAFLRFALDKLRQVAKDLIHETRYEVPLPEVSEHGELREQLMLEEQLLRVEQIQILLEAIKGLDQRMGLAIWLKFFRGLSDAEISERLQVTVGHVRVLRNRGIAQLRANPTLKAYFDQE